MINSVKLTDECIKYNTIQAYIIAMLTLLPTTSIFVYIKFAIVLLLVIGNMYVGGIYFSKKLITSYLLWGINIIISAVSVLVVESDIDTGTIIHEIQRLIFYLMLYLLCNSFKVKFNTFVHICRLLLFINLGIQLLQYFRIGDTYSFLRSYYVPAGESTAHLDMAYWVETGYFRSGSLFLNPNVYILYPIIFELVFLEKIIDKARIPDLCWLIACIVSIYLTGSRTGLILFVSIYIYNSISKRKLSLNDLVLPVVLVAGFIILTSSFGGNMGARIFQLADGVSGSTDVKFKGLSWYFEISNPIYWVLGSLGSNSIWVVIDMEIGHIFTWFGVLGLCWYIKIIKDLAEANKDTFKTLSRGIQIVVVLTAFSSSTILNMSVFPFITLITYSNIYHSKKGIG